MVLADPRLVEAEPVEPLHQLQVAVHAGRGVLVHRMERRQENAVTEVDLGHAAPLRLGLRIVRGLRRSLKARWRLLCRTASSTIQNVCASSVRPAPPPTTC